MDIIKRFQIVNADCLDVLKVLPDGSIPCIVTSPPYSDMRKNSKHYCMDFDFKSIAREIVRILPEGGVVCWNVGDKIKNGNESLAGPRQATFFQDLGFNVRTLIYQKNGGFHSYGGAGYNHDFEYVFICSKGRPRAFNPLIDKPNARAGEKGGGRGKIWLPDGTQHKRGKEDEYIIPKDSKRGSIWIYSPGGNKTCTDGTVHPALMHEQLCKDLIFSFSNEGDLILDPFAGGGTTLKVARELDRRAIGIEIMEANCRIIEGRVPDCKRVSAEELRTRIMMSAAAHLN